MISVRTPRRASWFASIRPVGPAPTTRTSVSTGPPSTRIPSAWLDGDRVRVSAQAYAAAPVEVKPADSGESGAAVRLDADVVVRVMLDHVAHGAVDVRIPDPGSRRAGGGRGHVDPVVFR